MVGVGGLGKVLTETRKRRATHVLIVLVLDAAPLALHWLRDNDAESTAQ